ncbi:MULTISPECIES: hypothetical protein [Rhizobium/Agrobacterium group]|uniref:hypothetical protein n=1 Tax=Rhizobium/Agrobacterium group TaxID=227290 RepID=UPI001178986C|nr:MULTISPECIES: hypothetical protein [Rhizobium/Agrobacterium group]MCF1484520.1 hypothetical protein [Allorhizobium ampelinum]NSZ43171.1 hypothetical protein [Agrobacterium vitis]NTA26828.1 hypothetical protein [Allorhizobium ampelinum]
MGLVNIPARHRERVDLRAKEIACTPVHAEDHGWDFEIHSGDRRYRVVCSCEFDEEGISTREHFVKVAQFRGAAVVPDPVLATVRDVLMAAADIEVLVDQPKR